MEASNTQISTGSLATSALSTGNQSNISGQGLIQGQCIYPRPDRRILPYPTPRQENLTELIGRMLNPLLSYFDRIFSQMFEMMQMMMAMLQQKSAASDADKATSSTAAGDQATSAATPSDTDAAGTDGSASSTGTAPTVTSKAPAGFLWKPKSDKNGKLVILTPNNLAKKVTDVKILSPDGKKVLESGKWAGIGNGDRGHFRFNHAGSYFPPGCIVEMHLKDGTTKRIKIGHPEKRIG